MSRRTHLACLLAGPVVGAGLVAAVVAAVLGAATPTAPQVAVTDRSRGPIVFVPADTTTTTLTISTLGSTMWSDVPGIVMASPETDAVISVAVAPDKVGDLLAAIAGRGVVVSMRMPDNYCRPERERTPVAQPDISVNVAAR